MVARSSWRRRLELAVLALALTSAPACGIDLSELDIDFDFSSKKKKKKRKKRKKRRGDDDDGGALGVAAFPAGEKGSPASHEFFVRAVKPRDFELGYRLSRASDEKMIEGYHTFAKRMGYQKIDENRFRWAPPRRCFGGLHCVYEELEKRGRLAVRPIAALFRGYAKKHDLNTKETVELVVSFVQHIRYEIPEEHPFGVLPPGSVVKQKRGDCDSKALLGFMILRELGVRSVVLSSKSHAHSMLGIAVPSVGKTFDHRGTTYAFLETTAKGSPIGHINPELLRPNDWKVMEMNLVPDEALPAFDAPPPPEEEDDDPLQKRDIFDVIEGGD